MRNRYFSPTHQNYQELQRQRNLRKLRSAGSANKVSMSARYEEDFDVNVGSYTYYKNKILGEGYSSKVYMAKKRGDQTIYAIKAIDLKDFSSINLSMLRSQISIIKTLNHPNVVKCYDVIKSRTFCYIVTEYCPDGDLHAFMTRKGRLPQQKAFPIIEQVIKGYQYLSEMNIIHRDLKPANILKTGNTWKIADFGFAVISENQIKTKYNVGTPLYMPLQSLICNQYSLQSDIFSIGIILYELIIGCTPWQSRTENDLILKMRTEKLKIPYKFNISSKVRTLLQKMCSAHILNRMNKIEFLQLNLTTEELRSRKYSGLQLQYLLKERQNKFPNKSASYFGELQLKKQRSHPTLPDTQEQDEYFMKKMEIKNNHILINQLHYCRFLYYFTRNRQYLLVSTKQCEKVVLIVFRHLFTLINQLSDSQKNWLKLEQWQRFVQSKRYKNTMATIKQYQNRYKKQYNSYIQSIDISTVEEVNLQFGDPLQNISFFSFQYYHQTMTYLQNILKELSNILGLMFLQGQQLGTDQIGQIEILNILYKYYELVSIGYLNHENYVYFEASSEIKVHVDYKNSDSNMETYLQISEKLYKLFHL